MNKLIRTAWMLIHEGSKEEPSLKNIENICGCTYEEKIENSGRRRCSMFFASAPNSSESVKATHLALVTLSDAMEDHPSIGLEKMVVNKPGENLNKQSHEERVLSSLRLSLESLYLAHAVQEEYAESQFS